MKKTILILFLALASVLPSAGQVKELTPDQKLRAAQAIIDRFYVEEVDNDTIVTEAIKAMLKTLDPHSAYTTPQETKDFTEPLNGKFSGIGIQFNMLEDTVYVIQTISGGPSEKVGIVAGDRIISANDTLLAGKKLPNSKVMKSLRGPKGSHVMLEVKRGEEFIDFDVVRDDIPLYSVDESFMANPTTGYIHISRFAEETPEEVRKAIAKLRGQGMQDLIIDLSDNGGGYLGAAFELAQEFLPFGTPVVKTIGRAQPEQKYVTEKEGSFLDGKLVIITNQYSASAAEILSGAIQDNDRGLIVGRRTFGKGLVQRPFPFPDGSMIRLTVSRYYTPSGRCIQKPYDKGRGEEYNLELLSRYKDGELWHSDSIPRPDSLRYETLVNHRPVYGGGGIIPDVFVPADTSYYSVYYRDLVAKGLINRSVINYVDANRKALLARYKDEDAFARDFRLPDALTDSLISLGKQRGIEFNEEQWNRSRPLVEGMMTGLIARDLYENASYTKHIAPLVKEYNTALELIADKRRYEAILKGEEEK